jgi:pyruvate formate lyase activating enzyme
LNNKAGAMNNHKPVYNITPVSMLDYPGFLATIIWFAGCNLRCGYCYNPDIVFSESGKFSEEDTLFFLNRRKGVIEGVVLSGGECTGYENITDFCREIKKLGFRLKIDTNGTNPHILEILILNRIVDFIALDYKAPEYKYTAVCGAGLFNSFSESLDMLIKSDIQFEVRTTAGYDKLNLDDLKYIASDLKERGYDKSYYIQNFRDTGELLGNADSGRKIVQSDLKDFPLQVHIRE